MKKNIELQLEMMLTKLENLKQAEEALKVKLLKMQQEIEKYEKSSIEMQRSIATFGLRYFRATPQKPVESPEEQKKRIEYNNSLQAEKKQFIETITTVPPEEVLKVPSSEAKDLISLVDTFLS